MGEFFLFMLILFTFGGGAAFLIPYLTRRARGIGETADRETLARLLEDMDQLSNRLTQIEEEMGFYRELQGRGHQASLPAPGEGEEGTEA